MNIPTLAELKETFEFISTESHQGIPGVIYINSDTPGPIIGITACTHGNEPCGLAAIRHILSLQQTQPILKGILYLIVNNIDAAANFFQAETDKEKKACRFVHLNMNRLTEDVYDSESTSSEVVRVKNLKPIFDSFEYGLDIHSTTQDNGHMLIVLDGELPILLTRGFPMDVLILDIDKIQIGRPVSSYYGTVEKKACGFGIEGGAHEDSQTYERAMRCAEALLINLGMLPGETQNTVDEYDEYKIYGSVMFPNSSYKLEWLPENLELARRGVVIASGDGPDLSISRDSHVIMAYDVRPKDISEEICFLAEPVRKALIK